MLSPVGGAKFELDAGCVSLRYNELALGSFDVLVSGMALATGNYCHAIPAPQLILDIY